MKGKRRTPEEKIRILRQADGERTILEICAENNISEQTFHRWKKEFGLLDVKQAKRLKELEAENTRQPDFSAGGRTASPDTCPINARDFNGFYLRQTRGFGQGRTLRSISPWDRERSLQASSERCWQQISRMFGRSLF